MPDPSNSHVWIMDHVPVNCDKAGTKDNWIGCLLVKCDPGIRQTDKQASRLCGLSPLTMVSSPNHKANVRMIVIFAVTIKNFT